MMIPNYYFLEIGFFDLILISTVEIAFIWFFFPKEVVGKVFSMVGAANLIKIGIMSLISPSIPSITENLNQLLLVEVTLIFILGVIISTLIYEKEQWALTRENAGALAFRITSISSLIWVTYKCLQPHIYYYPVFSRVPVIEALYSDSKILPIPHLGESLDIFGLLILVLGLLILYFHYKGKPTSRNLND